MPGRLRLSNNCWPALLHAECHYNYNPSWPFVKWFVGTSKHAPWPAYKCESLTSTLIACQPARLSAVPNKLQLKHMFLLARATRSPIKIHIRRSVQISPLWRCLSWYLAVCVCLFWLPANLWICESVSLCVSLPHVERFIIPLTLHPHYFWLLCRATSQLCLD